jgi:hypothetical protein
LRYLSGELVDFIHETTKMHTIMNTIERIEGFIHMGSDYRWKSTHNKFIVKDQVFTRLLNMIYSQIIILNDDNKCEPIIVTVIQDKIKRMCQNHQVDLVKTLPQFKSQRCFKCGFVHKQNRF